MNPECRCDAADEYEANIQYDDMDVEGEGD